MPEPDPPVVVSDGSLIVEMDEPLELDGAGPKQRPHKYKRKKGGTDVNIRRVIVKRGSTTVFDSDFAAKECRLEIFYEPKPPSAS